VLKPGIEIQCYIRWFLCLQHQSNIVSHIHIHIWCSLTIDIDIAEDWAKSVKLVFNKYKPKDIFSAQTSLVSVTGLCLVMHSQS